MPLSTSRTGEPALGSGGLVDGEDTVVLTFAAGLPGFPRSHRFVLEDLGAGLAPFCRMRSLDEPGIAFTVVPPGAVVADYRVSIDAESVERLGIASEDDVVVLAIVTLSAPPAAPNVNLLGPIVVNRHTRAAAQVVQHGSDYGVAVPLTP